MRILLACILIWSGGLAVWAQEAEIIIEMQGPAETAVRHPLWDRSSAQLTRQWKHKTREQLLYQMPSVSDKDRLIRGPKAEYALVEYYNGPQFRKFLFRAETPQTFIAVATTPQEILQINQTYRINLGLKQTDFETVYTGHLYTASDVSLPVGSYLYTLTDPATAQIWYLFENGTLSRTFYTAKEKEQYLKSLAPVKSTLPAQPSPKPTGTPVRKALVSGGTIQDQAYMPKVINPKPMQTLPPLTPSQP